MSCHNTHADTPKTDWKVGDVRGVLEIIRPLSKDVERVRSGGGRRRGARAIASLLKLGLLLAIFAMLSFLSTRYSQRFDWTQQRVNTLSAASLELLSRFDRDVVLTAFFKEQVDRISDLVDQLLINIERLR